MGLHVLLPSKVHILPKNGIHRFALVEKKSFKFAVM